MYWICFLQICKYWNCIVRFAQYSRSQFFVFLHCFFFIHFSFAFCSNGYNCYEQPQQISIWKRQSQTHKSLGKCLKERNSLLYCCFYWCFNAVAIDTDGVVYSVLQTVWLSSMYMVFFSIPFSMLTFRYFNWCRGWIYETNAIYWT